MGKKIIDISPQNMLSPQYTTIKENYNLTYSPK
jgi:hypothetical protein